MTEDTGDYPELPDNKDGEEEDPLARLMRPMGDQAPFREATRVELPGTNMYEDSLAIIRAGEKANPGKPVFLFTPGHVKELVNLGLISREEGDLYVAVRPGESSELEYGIVTIEKLLDKADTSYKFERLFHYAGQEVRQIVPSGEKQMRAAQRARISPDDLATFDEESKIRLDSFSRYAEVRLKSANLLISDGELALDKREFREKRQPIDTFRTDINTVEADLKMHISPPTPPLSTG